VLKSSFEKSVGWTVTLSLPTQIQLFYSEREIPLGVEALAGQFGVEALAGQP